MTVMMGEKGEEYSKKSQNISMNDRVPLPLPLPVVKSTMQGIGFFSIGSGYKIEIYHMKPNQSILIWNLVNLCYGKGELK